MYLRKIHQLLSREFISFIFAGGIAAIANFVSRILLNCFFSFPVSVLLSYIIGMTTAYILMKYKVFKNPNQITFYSISMFCLVNIIAFFQTFVISVGGTYLLKQHDIMLDGYYLHICHGIGIVFPVFTSYLGHKLYTFK